MQRDSTTSVSTNLGLDESMMEDTGSALKVKARFEALDTARFNVLERARSCAKYTIPHIQPPEGVTEHDEIPTPYQAVGARLVNNLANKMLLTLFPVQSPFFRFDLSEAVINQMQDEGDSSAREEITAKLHEEETIVQKEIEGSGARTPIHEALRSLVVTGNKLMHIPAKGTPRVYSLDKYVVVRSSSGKVLEIILKEIISKQEIPQKWKDQLETAECDVEMIEGSSTKRTYECFTRVTLEKKKYVERKYIHDVLLEGSEASYPEDASAWIALRWSSIAGEDYGRSYCEEYLGDLRTLEGLTKAVTEHGSIASKIFGVVRPSALSTPEDYARVRSGGFLVGNADDIMFPEVGKYNDMRSVTEQIQGIVSNLSAAFLMTQTRDAERVTAEEVRQQAADLETALGGAYSLQSSTFQEPLLFRYVHKLRKSGDLADIDKKDIDMRIVVGLDGLGRGTDLDKLMRAVGSITQLAQSSQMIPRLDMNGVVAFVFNAVGLDTDGILIPEEVYEQQQLQEQQTAMQAGLMDKMAGPLAQSAVDNPEQVQQLMQGIQQ